MVRPKIKNGRQITLYLSEDIIHLINEHRKNLSISSFIEQAILAVVKGQQHSIKISQNLLSTQNELKHLQEENEKLRREKEKLEKKLAKCESKQENDIEKILLSPQQRKWLQRKRILEQITEKLSSALESTEEWRAPLKELCQIAKLDYSSILTILSKDLTVYDGHKTTLWHHKDIEVKRESNEVWLYKDGWWERAHKEEIDIIGEMLREGRTWEDIVREYYLKTQGREPYNGEIIKMVYDFWKPLEKKRYMAKFYEGWYMEKQDGSYILHREIQHQSQEVKACA